MAEPVFAPTPDGFTDAVARAARRRRRRHAVAAGASGGALAVVAALALAGTAVRGTDGLQQLPGQPAAPPSSERSPDADPAAPALGPAEASSAPADGEQQPSSVQLPTAAAPSPSAAATADAASGAVSRPRISTPTRLVVTPYRQSSPCADISGRAAGGWCMQVDADWISHPGAANDLSVSLCRISGFGAATASFPSSAEAGYELETSGQTRRTLWRHATQHPGEPRRHDRTVEAGTCLTWTSTWWNRDDAGADLPVGRYQLRFAVHADNVGAPNGVVEQGYSYTVEERDGR